MCFEKKWKMDKEWVLLVNGIPVVSSREVAKRFEKQNKHINP